MGSRDDGSSAPACSATMYAPWQWSGSSTCGPHLGGRLTLSDKTYLRCEKKGVETFAMGQSRKSLLFCTQAITTPHRIVALKEAVAPTTTASPTKSSSRVVSVIAIANHPHWR